MSQVLEAPLATSQVDWDAVMDDAFRMGQYNRMTKDDDWTFVTGMQVNFPELRSQVPAGSKKLFVLADTITIAGGRIPLFDGTNTILMSRAIAPKGETLFDVNTEHRVEYELFLGLLTLDRNGLEKLQIAQHYNSHSTRDAEIKWALPTMKNFEWLWLESGHPRRTSTGIEPIPRSVPLGPCKAFLTRMHLAVLSLVNEGKLDLASQLTDKLQQLLSLFPADVFTDLRLQIVASRELMQPLRSATDFVPYLSPSVYADVAEKYGPALEAYANTFSTFIDRTINVTERQAAARLILNREKNASRFQALVTTQLDENLRIANENVGKATTSMGSQQSAVDRAKSNFEAGMQKWKEQKEREAAMAIASAAVSFVSGVASIVTGNPNGAAAAANAAEQVEKAATTLQKLAEIMKKLVTIGKVIAKVAEMALAIQKALAQMESAKDLADRMSRLTAATNEPDMAGAPSAGAYWDQLWVELETQLAAPMKLEIEGADQYLKELKVLIIYGRALTTAQAALVPLMQEIARAALQAEIVKSQQKDVEDEIERLKASQAVSAEAAAMLWIRYKTVQRSMLIALQNFDAAHRYWALTDALPTRDMNRPILDIAGDLLEIANIKARQQAAFDSFQPPPEDFTKVPYEVSKEAVEEFLKTGQLTLRFTPRNNPMAGWGRIGRVRVDEVFVWVEWQQDERPEKGLVGFKIHSNGIYSDQRLDHGKMQSFNFIAKPLNFTFRYDLKGYSEERRDSKIRSHAAVAEKFRTAYSEPTLFTEWHISLFSGEEGQGGTIDRAALANAVSGITVEFSGTLIDDPGLLRKRARLAS